ncbi:hypothetical protein [uncultured Salinisphaera sp.]|uniref:hypothetical protein n=1 Tax=uncultured Salinisphaera sp. TaxID=359372 RepID=UPI0032B30AA1|tara:strand:- start:511 stop:1326 length:816 start_codon:yes stop_codon:yes gene_type:complete
MSDDDNTFYILGTGRSLLDLGTEERRYLDSHPRTLGMNRFYLNYERLDICPSMLILSDVNYYADLILRGCIERLNSEGRCLPYYVSDEYLRFYRTGPFRELRLKRRVSRRLKRKTGYKPGPLPAYDNLRGFPVSNEAKEFYWATDFETPLYHRRGSLTVAINLANILYPDCDIKLLGIDLSNPGYFYDDLITAESRDMWVDEKYDQSKEAGTHASARPKTHDSTTLCDVMRNVMSEFNRQGRGLYCCNPQSLLVTEKVVPYAPVIAAGAGR